MLRNSLPYGLPSVLRSLRMELGCVKSLTMEFAQISSRQLKGNSVAVKRLRETVIDAFNDSLMRRVAT